MTWLFILFHMYSQIHRAIFTTFIAFVLLCFFLVLMICFSLLPSLPFTASLVHLFCMSLFPECICLSCFSIFPPLFLFCAPRLFIHPTIATTRRFVKSKKGASHLLAVCLLISFIPSRSIPERWNSCRS